MTKTESRRSTILADPAYRAEVAELERLKGELKGLKDTIDEAELRKGGTKQTVNARAEALLRGDTAAATGQANELDKLHDRRRVLDRACELQNQKAVRARQRATVEIVEGMRPQYLRAVRDVQDGVERLLDALAKENDLIGDLSNFGCEHLRRIPSFPAGRGDVASILRGYGDQIRQNPNGRKAR